MDIKTKIESLKEEYFVIYNYCSSEYDEQPDTIMKRISALVIYSARLSKMLTDSEYIANLKTEEALADRKITEFSASIQKEFIKSYVKNEQHLYRSIERLSNSITHQLDGLRTQLSFIKSELTNTN